MLHEVWQTAQAKRMQSHTSVSGNSAIRLSHTHHLLAQLRNVCLEASVLLGRCLRGVQPLAQRLVLQRVGVRQAGRRCG